MLKVLLAGDASVGKTSIARRFVKSDFTVDYKTTIGMDVFKKIIEYKDGRSVTLSIWDLAGQDRYNFMRNNLYQGSDGVILVYDITRLDTFTSIQKWLTEVRTALGEKIPFILIGNKIDLLKDVGEVIDKNEPKEFAQKHGCAYKETSAKTGFNVEEVFNELIDQILKSRTYSVDMYTKLWQKMKKDAKNS